jgi:ubiquinone/menaquinone biosynthesis C-methylase UbiE
MTDDEDVPYGENFHDEGEASAWADAAIRKRPWRRMIFERFATAVQESSLAGARVLELGSGPGFLAEHVLDRCPSIEQYTLLDFSEAMLALSRSRLSQHVARTSFVRADFKSDAWPAAAGAPFDFVLSLQAVHELRHKRHAQRLYEQVRSVASPGAQLIVCDHLPESAPTPRHRVLYMTVPEYLEVLGSAGFAEARVVWSEHRMAMYRARC